MKRLFVLILLLLLLGGAVAYFAVPWNAVLEKRITAYLDSHGFKNIAFKINRVGLHQATFDNIQIGTENPLLLQSVTVQYKPKELLDGNIRDLSLTGLDIKIQQTDEGWKIAGISEVLPKSEKRDASPTLSDIVDLLPFTVVDVKDSFLRIEGKSIQTALPFNLRLTKAPQTTLNMTINATNLAAASSEVSLGVIAVKAQPDENRNWNGTWSAQSLNFGEALPVPELKGEGTLKTLANQITADGTLLSADKKYNTAFTVLVDTNAPAKNTLTVKSASFPFKQGIISAKNTVIPFDRSKNITLNLDVKKVSLNDLMQTLTGQRVTATGTVSGRMPVILRPDGSYTLGKGTLKADSNGLIQMPPEVIPATNEKAQLVRDILENLHYSLFSAGVDTSGKDGLVVRLSLEGNNPDVYNGRIVKLNVNLTGDVLDFIQQNAMLITNPEKLLEAGTK